MTDKPTVVDWDRYYVGKNGSFIVDLRPNPRNNKRDDLVRIKKHNKEDYLVCCLWCVDGKFRQFLHHRVVGYVYLPNPDNLPEINHRDANKQNNDASNLEWNTHKENCDHRDEMGLIKNRARGERLSRNRKCSKLTEADVYRIRGLHRKGLSEKALCEMYSYNRGSMHHLLKGNTWAHLL